MPGRTHEESVSHVDSKLEGNTAGVKVTHMACAKSLGAGPQPVLEPPARPREAAVAGSAMLEMARNAE